MMFCIITSKFFELFLKYHFFKNEKFMHQNQPIFLRHMQIEFKRAPYPGPAVSIFPFVEPMYTWGVDGIHGFNMWEVKSNEEHREQGEEGHLVKTRAAKAEDF